MTEGDRAADCRGHDYDVVVVGSGFGGSVTAMRLSEKGYRVLVLEAGRRFRDEDLPKTSWRIRDFLWAPWLGCYGIQRLTFLKDITVLSGAGVGGGSLVYANTLYVPPQPFFDDPQWGHITDWRAELAPHYDQAKRMLGVVENPVLTAADDVMREVAQEMGVGHTFRPTPVGVLFGGREAEYTADPYFGGVGPSRTTCNFCGACMTGCRVGAKNTLPKNYLHLAEAAGARIWAMATVDAVRPLDRSGAAHARAVEGVEDGESPGYAVDFHRTGSWGPANRRTITATHVVFAAGSLGTQRLLHRMVAQGLLPRVSSRLGHLTRTNSEAILGATARHSDVDYSRGVAITSSFFPDEDTHVEPVRYGRGSNAMGVLTTVLVPGDGTGARWLHFLREVAKDPAAFGRSLSVRRWSERGFVVLVMQSVDNSLRTIRRRGPFGTGWLTTRRGHGEPSPRWIPAGYEVTRRVAQRIQGHPWGAVTEVANIPVTAHILGGCPIGDSPKTGVVDPWHRVYGHPGLHVVDGAAVSANLGVNPALTITAQAERAMALWPNFGEADKRPPLGAPYVRLEPVPPDRPAVPADAPAALRFTPA